MATHVIQGVSEEKLHSGLEKLRRSGFTVDGNHVMGMGVEASFTHQNDMLTVDVEKAPPFLGGMIEGQLRQFFA